MEQEQRMRQLAEILDDLHAHGLAALAPPECSTTKLHVLLADYYRAYRALVDFVLRDAEGGPGEDPGQENRT